MKKIKLIVDGKEIEAMVRERNIAKLFRTEKLSLWGKIKRWAGIKE